MNKHDKTSEKQNDLLPPNTSWPDVLEEKLTPSEDTTGKWVASTTSFERKGLRFGMESSPASVDVKGSMRAEERERETEKQKTEESEEQRKMWDSESDNNKRKACRTNKVQKQMLVGTWWERWQFTCPCCRCWKPCGAWLHGGLESRLQVKKVALHLHCTVDRRKKPGKQIHNTAPETAWL